MLVKQIDVLLALFELFRATPQPMTLTRLSEGLGQPKSSMSNIVETLRRRGYLYEVARRGGFYPSRRMFDLMREIVAADPIVDRLHRHLLALAQDSGETALLGAMDADSLIYLDVVESSQPIRYFAKSGERRPLYATSGGKAILASMAEAERDALIARLDFSDRRPRTLATGKALRADLARGEARGWFTNLSEYTPDVTGVGVALRAGGRLMALSLAGPNYRLEGRHEDIARRLAKTARDIEAEERGS